MPSRLPMLLGLMLMLPAFLAAQTVAGVAGADARAADPFPPGKSLHFLGGMMLGLAAAGIVDLASDPQLGATHPWSLPLTAIAAAAAGGVAKELLDSTGFGDPRFTDILITTAGGLAAALAAGYAESLYPSSPGGRADGASFLISMALGAAIPVTIGFIGEIKKNLDRRAKERK